MKKLISIALVALSLGGCAALKNIETAIQLGTASATNPVTITRLNQMESAVTLVFAGLNAWKKSCVQALLPVSCKTQIADVQVYTRQIPPYLTQLRAFVETNDQVNATVLYNQIVDLIGTVKSQAAAGGVNIATNVGS